VRLADVSIQRPVFATVMVAVLVVFGVAAYPSIGVDLFPDVEFPFVTVTAVYPGADPESVESKVVDKLEEAVNTVNGIEVLRSTSMENVGLVVIQFRLERNADQAVQDVRDKISGISSLLPPDLEPPIVQKFDIGAAPILALALSGDIPAQELTRLAEDVVKAKLQTLQGVGGVDIVGGRAREFQVWVDPRNLEGRGIAIDDVLRTLSLQNIEVPGGRIQVGAKEFVVKTRGQVNTAEGLSDLIIQGGGGNVRIRDVAKVEDGAEEARSYSSLDGKSAVSLIVRKQAGTNTVEIAHRVHAALDALKASKKLPAGVTLSVPTDNSTFIEHSIKDVQFDLVLGAILAIVIILFFLHDWRATLISALAIPTSVIATFAFIGVMGFTFNNMTMLALSLSIGILVDDAIVVIENIHRHLDMGKTPKQAAHDGTAEIGLAVMATTASIVAVFVPVATMKGIIGRFFYQFGLTVAFAVTISLFVAFTLTPMLSSLLLRKSHVEKRGIAKVIEAFLVRIDRAYKALLGLALRHRWKTITLAFFSFVAALVIGAFIPFEFVPQEDRGMFNVTIELTPGTALPVTQRLADATAARLRGVPGVEATLVTAGGGTEGEVNRAEIQVNLVSRKERGYSQSEGMKYARSLFAGRTDAIFAVQEVNAVGGGGGFRSAMVQFNMRGGDYAELNTEAEKLMAALKKSGGYVDLDTTFRGGKPEVRVELDRNRSADLGVPAAALAMTVRNLVAGEKASEIATQGERYDVRVRLPDESRARPEDLLALRVRSSRGVLVPLSAVARIDTGDGPAKIERQDRQRQVTVFANLEGKALGEAVSEIEAFAKTSMSPTLTTDWAGMGDIMKDSISAMGAALLLAIVIVYLILAAQFESFLHPFTIMLSLPLSLIGALGGLYLAGMTMNIFSMIGVIMLMGLVTKNAILLVDYANHIRRVDSLTAHEALMRAGPVRLRPILMTTAAMILGMFPVALALSEGGEQRAPMAVIVIGGLITSTMLTLLVVPVAYSLLDGGVAWVGSKRKRAPASTPEPHAT